MTRIEILTALHPRPDQALDRAALLADRCGAELAITHSVDPASGTDRARIEEPRIEEQCALLRDSGGRLRTALALSHASPARWLALEGEARDVLPGHLEGAQPDLAVTGTGRDHTLPRIVLGSLTVRIAAASTVPILVVKDRRRCQTNANLSLQGQAGAPYSAQRPRHSARAAARWAPK